MSKKRLVPFRWLPGSWGLVGRVYDEAEAYYLYEGDELARRLIEIRHPQDGRARRLALLDFERERRRITPYAYALAVLALDGEHDDTLARARVDLEHGMLTQHAYEKLVAEHSLPEDSPALARALLDLDLVHGRIDTHTHAQRAADILHPEPGLARDLLLLEVEREFGRLDANGYAKQHATLMEEPWIGVLGARFDPSEGLDGFYFEFDWNDHWITFLRLNGYGGDSEQQVVDAWFTDVCRSQAAATDEGMIVPLTSFGSRGPFVREDGTFYR